MFELFFAGTSDPPGEGIGLRNVLARPRWRSDTMPARTLNAPLKTAQTFWQKTIVQYHKWI